MRPYWILAGPLRGRTIVTSVHDYPGAILGRTERPLLNWLAGNVKPGETWLDVGAHYGYTAIALAERVGKQGKVYAFEPSLTTVGHLARTRAINRLSQIAVVPLALGAPGSIRAIKAPVERGMADHGFHGAATEEIYVIGFDDIWSALGNHQVDGVKVDVQGMELQVLQGMASTLETHRPKVVIEFHTGVDRQPILDLLRNKRYRLPGQPVAPESGTPTEYSDDRSYAFEPQSR